MTIFFLLRSIQPLSVASTDNGLALADSVLNEEQDLSLL
jgi:hypothetical protein